MAKLKVRRRSFSIFIWFCVLLSMLLVRVAWIQIVDGEKLQRDAADQQTRDRPITSQRGAITDRNGKAIAVSSTVESVSISPSSLRKCIEDSKGKLTADTVAKGLSDILQLDEGTVLGKINRNTSYESIKRKIDKDAADKVRTFLSDNKVAGVNIDADSKRHYPFGNFASQLIGSTGIDNQGLNGIEAVSDRILYGVPGRVVSAKGANGIDMAFEYEKYVDPKDGLNVKLTIDESIQHFAEKHLEIAVEENKCEKGGIAIVMEVKTGEILAMATKPDFDLNDPFTIVDPKAKEEIAKLTGEEKQKKESEELQKMWRNKAVSDTYEPGSTFKIFTSAMALEEHLVSQTDSFSCGGARQVANRTIKCWKAGGHGSQSFAQAMQNSCNPAFMDIGARVGGRKFLDYFSGFGLNDRTDIELSGEASGLVHSLKNFNEVELATSSFGQTFTVTPLQMLAGVSAVANDGMLMWPHVVKEYTDKNNNVVESFEPKMIRQVVSKSTSAELRLMLEQVVTVGTAKNAYVAGYRVAGKTGTSEKFPRNNGKYIASFIGFAPADNPQVACLVLLDEPMGEQHFGGVIAAPVVGKIMEDTLRYLNIEPQYTKEELDALETPVPDFTGMTIAQAKQAIAEKNLKYSIEGDGEKVINQMPKTGARINLGSTVTLYTVEGEQAKMVTIPDVSKCTVSEATQRLNNSKLNIKIVGAAASRDGGAYSAFSQSPPAGTSIEQHSVVTVEFRTLEVGE